MEWWLIATPPFTAIFLKRLGAFNDRLYLFVPVPSGSLSLLKSDVYWYFKLKLTRKWIINLNIVCDWIVWWCTEEWAVFSPLLPSGFGSVPLFNQRKRNRVPLTSAPSENEFFFHSEFMASTSPATSASPSRKCWMKWKLAMESLMQSMIQNYQKLLSLNFSFKIFTHSKKYVKCQVKAFCIPAYPHSGRSALVKYDTWRNVRQI